MILPQLTPTPPGPVTPVSLRFVYKGSSTTDSNSYTSAGIDIVNGGSAPSGNQRRWLIGSIKSHDTTDMTVDFQLDLTTQTQIEAGSVLSNGQYWKTFCTMYEWTDTDTTKDLLLTYSAEVSSSSTMLYEVITGGERLYIHDTVNFGAESELASPMIMVPRGGFAIATCLTRNAIDAGPTENSAHNMGSISAAVFDAEGADLAFSYGQAYPAGGRAVCDFTMGGVDAMHVTLVSFGVK